MQGSISKTGASRASMGIPSLARQCTLARMKKTQVRRDKMREPSGHFNQAIAIPAQGRMVFISGITSRRADGTIAGVGDIEAQTRQVCENIKAAVEAAGGSLDDVCRVDVYVRNIEHFDKIHKVR